MQYECQEDGKMPQEFLDAVKNGAEVQINTCSVVGWMTVTNIEYRNGVEYRIKPKE